MTCPCLLDPFAPATPAAGCNVHQPTRATINLTLAGFREVVLCASKSRQRGRKHTRGRTPLIAYVRHYCAEIAIFLGFCPDLDLAGSLALSRTVGRGPYVRRGPELLGISSSPGLDAQRTLVRRMRSGCWTGRQDFPALGTCLKGTSIWRNPSDAACKRIRRRSTQR